VSLSGFPFIFAAVRAGVCTRFFVVVYLVVSDNGAPRSITDHHHLFVVGLDRMLVTALKCGFFLARPSIANTLLRVVFSAFHASHYPKVRLEVRCQQ